MRGHIQNTLQQAQPAGAIIIIIMDLLTFPQNGSSMLMTTIYKCVQRKRKK